MIESLPPRERQVFDALYRSGEASAEQIRDAMQDPPSNSAIRIMLSRLEKKGFVTHRSENQRFFYSPSMPDRNVRQGAVRHFLDTFFGGSPTGAAAALLGMAETIEPDELDRLEQLIAKSRQELRS